MRIFCKSLLVFSLLALITAAFLANPAQSHSDDDYRHIYIEDISCDVNAVDFGNSWTIFLKSLGLMQISPLRNNITHVSIGPIQTVEASYIGPMGGLHVKIFHYAYVYATGKICFLGTSEYIGSEA